jgi:hypothetical protein
MLSLSAVIFACLAPTPFVSATPTDSNAVWSWGGLFVHTYREVGGVSVVFKDARGVVFTGWKDKHGTYQCPGDPQHPEDERGRTLQIHPEHPRADAIAQAIFSAGLAHKPLHVWFEGVEGVCYIKGVAVGM